MAIKTAGSPGLAMDVKGAQDLRAQFKTDPQAGVKSAAQEFEALFLQMVMKSMRATTSQDSLMDSDSSRFFTGMLDQQVAKDLSRSGSLGLAGLLEQQLSQQMGMAASPPASISALELSDLPLARPGGIGAGPGLPAAVRPAVPAGNALMEQSAAQSAAPQTTREFVDQVWPHAVEASRSTGIPPQFLVAHAALESGWGKRDIRNADGSPSFNLFGIKAGKNWQGKTTEITTTEYVDGQPVKMKESFRAYGSYAESFQDYAQLLRNNPRYGSVIGSQDGTEFARRLQQAGYATDPGYAGKLASIINGPTLRQALIG
ncbi:MAG: flagellar assembly peptidoglycan hydrolase FlgJ [Azovibrio sp.]|uniref:flagellar assembly peptidoglycan hydrolase FlgJ n=1 Tax=Azovibrio sp. TaxID=1872673 RepID=UPI003C79077A